VGGAVVEAPICARTTVEFRRVDDDDEAGGGEGSKRKLKQEEEEKAPRGSSRGGA